LGFRWRRHRHFVGVPHYFDPIGRSQFELLTLLGLKPGHHVLDIGCGSLAAGKYLIPYLQAGHYCGIEPNAWLIADGIEYELGRRWVAARQPRFSHNGEFDLDVFGEKFDFLLAHSIFSHGSQAQIGKALRKAAQVIKPDGLFIASYFKSDRDYEGEQWVYPGGVAYTPQTIGRLAQASGLAAHETKWPDLTQVWLVFFDPRAETSALERIARADSAAPRKKIVPDPRGPAWFRAAVRRLPPALTGMIPRSQALPGDAVAPPPPRTG
jgi:SAM-dependent methyltransferase